MARSRNIIPSILQGKPQQANGNNCFSLFRGFLLATATGPSACSMGLPRGGGTAAACCGAGVPRETLAQHGQQYLIEQSSKQTDTNDVAILLSKSKDNFMSMRTTMKPDKSAEATANAPCPVPAYSSISHDWILVLCTRAATKRADLKTLNLFKKRRSPRVAVEYSNVKEVVQPPCFIIDLYHVPGYR